MPRKSATHLPVISALFLTALLLGFAGCSTLQEDLLLDPTGDVEFLELEALEISLVEIRQQINENEGKVNDLIASDLKKVRKEADSLADDDSLNRQYLARLESVRGLEAWLSGEPRRAGRHLQDALEVWELDELSMVLESFLIEDNEETLLFLDTRIIGGENLYRLEVERGAVLFILGRFGEAVAAWDSALPFLPVAYQTLFSSDREKAWVLKDSDSSLEGESLALIGEGPISFGAMVKVTEMESSLLNGIDSGRDLEGEELFAFLMKEGFLTDTASVDLDTRRRDAALFLWSLLAEKLNDPSMLNLYSLRFEDRASPIPDLKVTEAWFDAALGCVQTEIMSLPDGEKFFPDLQISGLDYIGWLEAVVAY